MWPSPVLKSVSFVPLVETLPGYSIFLCLGSLYVSTMRGSLSKNLVSVVFVSSSGTIWSTKLLLKNYGWVGDKLFSSYIWGLYGFYKWDKHHKLQVTMDCITWPLTLGSWYPQEHMSIYPLVISELQKGNKQTNEQTKHWTLLNAIVPVYGELTEVVIWIR